MKFNPVKIKVTAVIFQNNFDNRFYSKYFNKHNSSDISKAEYNLT